MDPISPRNGLEATKLIVSALTPLIIAAFGIWFNLRLKKIDDKKQKEIANLTSKFTPHIEFDIDCKFFGPCNGKYAAQFIMTASNKGITRHKFDSIILRVRGIKEKSDLSLWKPLYPCRLKFPEELLKDDVVPHDMEYYFVEPGVCQRFNYITIIEKGVKFITARAEFKYTHKNYKPHTAERMFELPCNRKDKKNHSS